MLKVLYTEDERLIAYIPVLGCLIDGSRLSVRLPVVEKMIATSQIFTHSRSETDSWQVSNPQPVD